VLFGIRGKLRTLAPGRREVNMIVSRKQEHSRKPRQVYDIIERCSPGPYLELFARGVRRGWRQWGDEVPTNGDLTKLHALPFILEADGEQQWSYSEQRVLTGIR
jgi:N6-adenosine-specific RNA methylase IME4